MEEFFEESLEISIGVTLQRGGYEISQQKITSVCSEIVTLFYEISQTNIAKFREKNCNKFRETLAIWWARSGSRSKSNRTRLKIT
jgi:hypothetical protein